MSRTIVSPRDYGGWALVAISLVGVILAAFNYLDQGDGIAYSPGALLVLVATALILGASIVMMLDRVRTTWLAALLAALIILGAIGAALAAYFLDAYWLMALMIVGLLACLIHLVFSASRVEIAEPAVRRESRS